MQLTATEYSTWYAKILKKFATVQTVAWQEKTYKVRKNYNPIHGKLLFLYAFALDTWEHTDGATNYLTEEQVMSIIHHANQI